MSAGDRPDLPEPQGPAVPRETLSEFANYVVIQLFSVGLTLDSARSIVGDGPASDRIALATEEVDRLIRDIRMTQLDTPADDRLGPLRDRMAHTARALEATALDAATLLERRAAIDKRPSRVDVPAEVKRWRAFARHAEQMAERWERR